MKFIVNFWKKVYFDSSLDHAHPWEHWKTLKKTLYPNPFSNFFLLSYSFLREKSFVEKKLKIFVYFAVLLCSK